MPSTTSFVPPGSTTILADGPIFDGLRLLPADTAMAVTDDRITLIGPRQAVIDRFPGADRRDLGGRLVHPGFTDAHIHALSAGVDRNACDLTSASTEAEALEAVARYAASTDRGWIVGSGWSMSSFPGGCPTAASLDTVCPDRPAFLLNRDHHGAWVNSAALRLAGIDAHTPDPPDGRIERTTSGEPTGTLHEGAMDLVGSLAPAADFDESLAGLLTAQQYLHSLGVTGWQEAIVGDYSGMTDLDAVYRYAADAGLLTGDVVGASWLPRPTTVAEVESLVTVFADTAHAAAGSPWRRDSVKIMVDGVVENRTALLTEPYEGSTPGCACGPDHGLAYFDVEVLDAMAVACDAAGLDLHFHAIGDRAVHVALNAVERARLANGVTRGRHHIAHIQLIDPLDIPRFAHLDVTANMQALWACNDDQMRELVHPAIGSARYDQQYPFADLLAAGTRLAMGSDWPVSTPDPWAAISVAVNRTEPGSTSNPLLPAQALTVGDCLRAYTAESAWINRRDTGRLRIGAPADLVVADRNPFAIDPAELSSVSTDLTVARGRVVYERTRS